MTRKRLELTPETWRQVAMAGLAEGDTLRLPAPSSETIATALAEPPEADLDDVAQQELRLAQTGGRCDAQHWQRTFFQIASGTRFDAEEDRHELIRRYTQGTYTSLSAFLAEATEAEAALLIAYLAEQAATERTARQMAATHVQARTYDQVFDQSEAEHALDPENIKARERRTHKPACPRSLAWDAGEWQAPCTCRLVQERAQPVAEAAAEPNERPSVPEASQPPNAQQPVHNEPASAAPHGEPAGTAEQAAAPNSSSSRVSESGSKPPLPAASSPSAPACQDCGVVLEFPIGAKKHSADAWANVCALTFGPGKLYCLQHATARSKAKVGR